MSGGIRSSVKGYLIAQRLNSATDPLSESETISNNVIATHDPLLQSVKETTLDSATYRLGMCDGSIPWKRDFAQTQTLVYEFMLKGSLEHDLFGSELQTAHYGTPNICRARTFRFELLSWNLRMKIAFGAAKGLAFLHSDKANVIFVDFQTSKVLDKNYNVKLCGYALDKDRLGPYKRQLLHVDEICQYEDEQRRDAYTAPEYKYFGKESLTSKSNVYSFGVILLELLSSRRAFDKNQTWISSDDSDLLRVAYTELSREDKVSVIVDTRLDGQTCSLHCLHR